ncbi:hypothetical protein K2Q16_03185 [Patescibacteria group bacterium]|nr:hypothetical protein [Patescibacteria group bacterium]
MKMALVVAVVGVYSILGAGSVSAAAIATGTAGFSTPAEVEGLIRERFKEVPAMIEIARCESKFRQYNRDGSVLRGGVGGGMVGVYQFFESVHEPGASALGHNLHTLEGNVAYAEHVHDTQGTTPWNSSRLCWDVPVSTTNATPSDRASLLKKIELLTQIVALLKQLNAIV